MGVVPIPPIPASPGSPTGKTAENPSRETKASPPPAVKVNREQIQRTLDRLVRHTRFQYRIKEGLGNFVVRIIDADTDKVIKEIPSAEMQNVQDAVEQALGLLFDEKA